MNIQIDESYRIVSDSHNVTVEIKRIAGEKSYAPGEVTWIPVSFHRTVKQAAIWLLERNIRASDCTTLESLIDAFQKTCEQIIDAIEKKPAN